MTSLREVVILSLEPWDDVWRRNQLLVNALTDDLPELRVLFVEPPLGALRSMRRGERPRSEVRPTSPSSRVDVLRPVEWIPDRLSPQLPPLAGSAIRRVAGKLRFDHPVLWINDHSLARFALHSGWPVVYDITDDWLLADLPAEKRRRAELDDQLLLRGADTVVVCSPALATSRGSARDVSLIPNGVDVDHFTTPQPRPDDLGARPVAVYVGTLHDERLDVRLCCEIADELTEVQFTYVGPDCLTEASRAELVGRDNVRLLGPRPYAVVPAYLQHADAIIIPHVVSPFTESLDPIKARECQAVGTPTVATAVAGFRDLGPAIRIARPEQFATELREAVATKHRAIAPESIWTWFDATRQFRAVLEGVIR